MHGHCSNGDCRCALDYESVKERLVHCFFDAKMQETHEMDLDYLFVEVVKFVSCGDCEGSSLHHDLALHKESNMVSSLVYGVGLHPVSLVQDYAIFPLLRLASKEMIPVGSSSERSHHPVLVYRRSPQLFANIGHVHPDVEGVVSSAIARNRLVRGMAQKAARMHLQ